MMTFDMNKTLFHDFSEGTEEFRESLLAQCLAELGSEKKSSGWTLISENHDADEIRELDDEDIEFLAAAGDLTAQDDEQL